MKSLNSAAWIILKGKHVQIGTKFALLDGIENNSPFHWIITDIDYVNEIITYTVSTDLDISHKDKLKTLENVPKLMVI